MREGHPGAMLDLSYSNASTPIFSDLRHPKRTISDGKRWAIPGIFFVFLRNYRARGPIWPRGHRDPGGPGPPVAQGTPGDLGPSGPRAQHLGQFDENCLNLEPIGGAKKMRAEQLCRQPVEFCEMDKQRLKIDPNTRWDLG